VGVLFRVGYLRHPLLLNKSGIVASLGALSIILAFAWCFATLTETRTKDVRRTILSVYRARAKAGRN
jgi:hypothetical protein